jgi:putative hemolysin
MIFARLILIFILIGLNAFFVAIEFAAVTSRRARLDVISREKSRSYRIVSAWLESTSARDYLIAGSQLGITLVSLALGSIGEQFFSALLEPYFQEIPLPSWLSFLETIFPALPLVISLIIVTALHVIFGEQVPKVAVLRAPERFALTAAPTMDIFTRVFKGFINLLDWSTRRVLHLFGISPENVHSTRYSLAEFKELVSGPETEGMIEQPEREMLSAIIDFSGLVVRQVAVPRTEIIAVDAETPLPEIIEVALTNKITKIPVFDGSLDQIIGIIHMLDLLRYMQDNENRICNAREIMQEVFFVPETISVNQLLHEFRTRRLHLAIVLDEYGGTYGLVTLEDLLKEIIGEVNDQFDVPTLSVQTLPDGKILIDGMTFIEDINDRLNLRLTDPDYDTIAGFILGKLGHIPQEGDVVTDDENHVRLKVEKMDRLRIAQVVLESTNQDPPAA